MLHGSGGEVRDPVHDQVRREVLKCQRKCKYNVWAMYAQGKGQCMRNVCAMYAQCMHNVCTVVPKEKNRLDCGSGSQAVSMLESL